MVLLEAVIFVYVESIGKSRHDGHIHNVGARDKVIRQLGIFVNGSRQQVIFGIQFISGNLGVSKAASCLSISCDETYFESLVAISRILCHTCKD